MHMGMVEMGVTTELFNILDGVGRRYSRTESGSSHIYRICTVVDGRDAAFQIFGRCQQFNGGGHG